MADTRLRPQVSQSCAQQEALEEGSPGAQAFPCWWLSRSTLCVSLLTRTLVAGARAHPGGSPRLKILSLVRFAETLSPRRSHPQTPALGCGHVYLGPPAQGMGRKADMWRFRCWGSPWGLFTP